MRTQTTVRLSTDGKRSLNGHLKIRPPLSASIYLCTSNLYTLYVLALTVDQGGKLDSIGDDLA